MSSQHQPCGLIDRANLLRGDAAGRPPFEPAGSLHLVGRHIGVNVHNGLSSPLEIVLTPSGAAYLASLVEQIVEIEYPNQADGSRVETLIEWKASHNWILRSLFEAATRPFRDSGLELLNPASSDYSIIGTGSKSPIIGENVRRNEAGEVRSASRLWHFPNWQVESELETLLQFGRVEFAAVDRKTDRAFRAC